MSGDYSEVTSQNWFSRIMESIKAVLIGFVLFLVSFPLLAWNEYRAVTTSRSLEEGGKQLLEVPSDKVDAENEGKFIHLSGKATTDETVKDDVFGVSSEKTIRLTRKVEMYQWVEHKKEEKQKKLGGKEETVTTYTYTKEWSDKPINSSEFNDKGRAAKKADTGEEVSNPPFTYDNKSFQADKVMLGAFRLPKGLIDEIKKDEPLPVSAGAKGPQNFLVGENGFYKGASPSAPKIGDERVTFTVTKPTEVSLYGRQHKETIEPYQTKSGDALFKLRMGEMSGKAMIEAAEAENATMTWILRLVGFVLMVAGLAMMASPRVVVADVVPFFGNLLQTGTLIFAILIALPLTLLTIGLAWVAVRPMVGIPLVVGALAIIVGTVFLVRRKKKPAPTDRPPG